MNKKDSELCQESIEHWERMIDKMKWLIESRLSEKVDKLMRGNQHKIIPILEEVWGSSDCSLCLRHLTKNCIACPLFLIGESCLRCDSVYRKTIRANNIKQFIENAEKYMIPALREAKAFFLEREKNVDAE